MHGALWTVEEDTRLERLFAKGASQMEIARALPQRSWQSIQRRYYDLVRPEDRKKVRRKHLIAPAETYQDYAVRTHEKLVANREFGIHSAMNVEFISATRFLWCV